MKKLPDLREMISSVNIAEYLTDDALNTIGGRVVDEYEDDETSRSDWKTAYESAMVVARQTQEPKMFPWPNAANIKYPLITMAAIQFAARAYPEIVQNGKVAGCKVVGRDESGEKQKRADRVSMHMNYQLTDGMESWDEETDKMLHVLPIAGMCWRKVYYCPISGAQSEFIAPLDVVVHYHTKSLETCPRVTHTFPLHQNAIIEHQRAGEYLEVDLGMAQQTNEYSETEHDVPHVFLEQHRYWDLDGDGYQEPYIVTVHKDTRRVVRIVARYDEAGILMHEGQLISIKPINYFVKYGFIPAPDGSFYDIGFGTLLNPLNSAINTLINQLIDSGTLANTGGGFLGKGARLPGGKLSFKPGEWKPVDVGGSVLKDAIVPLPVSAPSSVLFQMLSLLIDVTKELSTVSSEMSGQQTSPNETATSTLTRIEQGMKVFSAVHKRIYRSLTQELKKIYRLNRLYVNNQTYLNIIDDQEGDVKKDYEDESIDVKPICDANMTTDVQRLMRAQVTMEIVGKIPGGNVIEAAKRALESLHIVDYEALLPKADQPPPPDPAAMELEMKTKQAQAELQMNTMAKQAEMQLKSEEMNKKMQLEHEKHIADMQALAAEVALKQDEMAAKMIMEQRKIDNERDKIEQDALRYRMDYELKITELNERMEMDRQKMDNEMRFKEYQHECDKRHDIDLKNIELGVPSREMELETKNKMLEEQREALENAKMIAENVAAAMRLPKQMIRGSDGKVTHVVSMGRKHAVMRDADGNISELIETLGD